MKKIFLFLLSFIPILCFAQGVYQATGDLKQTGNYPIIWDKNIKGGQQTRATKAQMLAIPSAFKDTSMTCYVLETDSTYRLQQNLSTWIAIAPGNIAIALKSIKDTLSNKIAALSSVYIKNQSTGTQAASFNINGTGAANGFSISGIDGSGNMFLPTQSTKPSPPISGMKIYGLNGLAWVTSNGFSRTLNWPNVTSDHVATFTDASGTVPFLESNQTWSGNNTFTGSAIIKGATPILTLTETINNYSSSLNKTSTSNQLSLTHQIYQAGGQGASLVFNGVNQYATGTIPSVQNSPISLSFWFKTTATNTQCLIRVIGGTIMSFGTVGGVLYYTNNQGGSAGSFPGIPVTGIGSGIVNDGQWHNIIATFPGNAPGGVLYVDGTQSTVNLNTAMQANMAFVLGSLLTTSPSNIFNGEEDQFLVYNTFLNAAQTAGIYNNGYGTASPLALGLIRRWEFDEAAGSIATDVIASGSIALINGVSWNLNGKIAKLGAVTSGTGFSFVDGTYNTERGQWNFGDPLGGTIIQGKAFRLSINNKLPLLAGSDGHISLDPNQNSLTIPDANGSYNSTSFLKIGAGSTTTSQLQLSASATLTPSAYLNGSLSFDGSALKTVIGGNLYTLPTLEGSQTWNGYNTWGITSAMANTPVNSVEALGTGNNTQFLNNGGAGILMNPRIAISTPGSTMYGVYINPSLTTVGVSGLGTYTNPSNLINGIYNVSTTTTGLGNGLALSVSVANNTISNISVVVQGYGYSMTGTAGGPDNISFQLPISGGSSITITMPIASITANATAYSLGVNGNTYVSNTVNATNFTTTGTGSVNTARLNTYQNGGTIALGGAGSLQQGTWFMSGNGELQLHNGVQQVNSLARLQIYGSAYSGTSGIARAVDINTKLTPSANNHSIIGLDVSPVYDMGATAIQAYNIVTSGTATVTGSTFLSFSGGTGSGFIIYVGGIAGSSTLAYNPSNASNKMGTGYTVGDVLTATWNNVILTLTVQSVGLTGISAYSARFNNDILLNYTPKLATSPAQFLNKNSTTGVIERYDLFGSNNTFTGSNAFSGITTAPTAALGTNTTQIATTAFVLANSAAANSFVDLVSNQSLMGTKTINTGYGSQYGWKVNSINYASGYSLLGNLGLIETSSATDSIIYGRGAIAQFRNGTYNTLHFPLTLTKASDIFIPEANTYTGNVLALRNDNISEFTNDANYVTTSYTGFKLSSYVPSWSEITGKPSFFSGSYIDLSNKPEIPDSFGWFKDKLLTNSGGQPLPVTNSNSGSQLYIAANWSNGYNEIDYFSIPGPTTSARGHHVFYTLNPNQGTSGGVVLDFGSFGDNNAFVTGGPLAPTVVDHLTITPNRIAVFDNQTNTMTYRTPQELASDLGYALGTGYAVLNGDNDFSGSQHITGNITATGNITTTSDIRVKKNITDLPYATDNLKNIKAVSFDRTDIDKHQIGVIAQNLQKYYPLLVEKDKKGMLSVNYTMFSAVLLKGWQEQQKEIEKLKEQVKHLKK